MKTPHKHAKLIKAWADGISLQKRYPLATHVSKHRADWHDFEDDFYPNWEADWIEYRIKPEPKPDVVKSFMLTKANQLWDVETYIAHKPNLKLTFDGGTGELKSAEVLE